MSTQIKPENAEMTQTKNTEEQHEDNQQLSNAPVASLKIEQVEDRANPAQFIIC